MPCRYFPCLLRYRADNDMCTLVVRSHVCILSNNVSGQFKSKFE